MITFRQAIAGVLLLLAAFAAVEARFVAAAVLTLAALLFYMFLVSDTDQPAATGIEEVPTVEKSVAAPETGPSSPVLWRLVLDGIPDPAMILDAEGIVVAANAAARDLLPVGERRHIAQVYRSPELLTAITLARETNHVQTCRTRVLAPVEQQLDGYVTPLQNHELESGPSILVVLRDATDQHQLAQMRADFVANASHELRTPLASLKGFIETLQGAARNDAAARDQFLPIMHEQATRMSRLIDDLLSLSLIEMREHVAPRSVVDLRHVANESIRSLEPVAHDADMSLSLIEPVGASTAIGDRDELVQVVQNLVHNAIKYGKPGGHVGIRIEPEGKRIALSVVDDGMGIASEHLPRLTERFYRVNAKDSRERGGTGLGLAIVKHIVNRHQGELRIASTVGEGSTFTVMLPSELYQK